ncbi:hypothetical protein DL93DRAFT_2092300 [Clavulina sp. PMI_390]|nr:hypothetical protein DL93DRAFT_2092300 [Clavulina sp. PMI_390]
MSDSRPSADAAASQSFSAPSGPPPLYERRDLPAGWIKEHDPQSDRDYYVDTLAEPPRSIWVHPLDDPDFVRTHRGDDASDLDESVDTHSQRPPSPYGGDSKGSDYPEDKKARRNDDDHLQVPSTAGAGSSKGHSRTDSAASGSSTSAAKKRGFFGKLKDKALGTKEEREAARKERERRRKEEERLYYERRDAMMAARQQQMEVQRAAYEERQRRYAEQQQQYYQQAGYAPQGQYYGRPPMNAYGGPTYQDPYAYGASPYGRRQQGGGIGPGGALLGGVVGGLLLGDLLGGF